MSDRKIPAHEIQVSRSLDIAIGKILPDILAKLPADVSRQVTDHVYSIMGTPAAKVPIEIVLRNKYEWLIKNGHIEAFTAQQIVAANKEQPKDDSFPPMNGTGPDETGMVV